MQKIQQSVKILKSLPKRYFFYTFLFLLGVVWQYHLHKDILWGFMQIVWYKKQYYFEHLHSYLIGKSSGNSFVSDIFMGMGGASIGALAIIFSISLFAAQQLYSTYSRNVIKIFIRDPISIITYIIVSALIFFFYGLSTFDQTILFQNNIGTFFGVGTLGLLVLVIMIFIHYYRSANIISPTYVVQHFSNKCIKKMKSLDKRMVLETSDIGLNMSPGEIKKFQEIDRLIPDFKNSVEEISNVIKKYRDRREYTIVIEGLKQIVRISQCYIESKKGLFIGSMSELYMMPGIADISHDRFFDDPDGVFEKLKQLASIAIVDKDVETIKKVVIALQLIAINSLSIKYRGEYISENHVFMMAVGYIDGVVRESGYILPDIPLQTASIINETTDYVFQKNEECIYMNSSKLIQVGQTIALHGLINPNARFLTKKGLEVILKVAHYSYLVKPYPLHREHIIDREIKNILIDYIKNIPRTSVVDTDFAVGNVFGDLNKLSMLSLVRHLAILIERTDDSAEKEILLDNLISLNETLQRFYRDLLEAAGETESDVILNISRDTRSIIHILAKLEQQLGADSTRRESIIGNISWYFSNYWRIYDFHTKISKNYLGLIMENIFEMVHLFKESQYDDLVDEGISSIVNIGEYFRKKEGKEERRYGYSVPRILLDGLLCALYANKTDKFLEAVAFLLDRGELALEKFQWEIFLQEYDDINDVTGGSMPTSEFVMQESISDQQKNDFEVTLINFMVTKEIFPLPTETEIQPESELTDESEEERVSQPIVEQTVPPISPTAE